jgi:myosin heavy subunit
MSKDAIIENYNEEIERLNHRLRNSNNGGYQTELEEIFIEIDGLNKTIEHLKGENIRLKGALGLFNKDD